MNQEQKIMKYIHEHGSISTMEAFFALGITRLPARVHDMRKKGIEFAEPEPVYYKAPDGEFKHYFRYKLA